MNDTNPLRTNNVTQQNKTDRTFVSICGYILPIDPSRSGKVVYIWSGGKWLNLFKNILIGFPLKRLLKSIYDGILRIKEQSRVG